MSRMAREVPYVYIDAWYIADTDKAVLVEVGDDYRHWLPLTAIEDPSVILKASPRVAVTIGVAEWFARKKGWV